MGSVALRSDDYLKLKIDSCGSERRGRYKQAVFIAKSDKLLIVFISLYNLIIFQYHEYQKFKISQQ